MASTFPRVPKRILYIYRKILMEYTEDNPVYATSLLSTQEQARKILIPICEACSPAELDRLATEAENYLSNLSPGDRLDPLLFKNSPGNPFYTYYDSPDIPKSDLTSKRLTLNRGSRYQLSRKVFLILPPLPIKNKKPWFEKWKKNPPEIPI
ncbi:hypothetical protein MXB_5366 [Myxobolus squamalis]|nr:hypothetical protein MXB_5366 [Myxobolus squamalis]